MFTDERRQVILSTLSVHGSASVSDLARMVRSSEITVRRDLKALEESGQVLRHRGGASVGRSSMDEPSYREKAVVAAEEKLAMAALAAELVDDGDVIMLCAGTSTQALAQRLTRRRLMVATNSVLVANALFDAPDVEVFLLGGILRGNIRAVIGGEAEKAVARLRFHKVFLSGNGLTAANGLSTPNMHVASIDRAAVASAKQVVVLADHTKVGVDSMVQTVETEHIDTLVTDSGADGAELDRLTAAGVEVGVAQPLEALRPNADATVAPRGGR
ncbi:MAG TPA: DeoR/GlpR family DNA-binding transcription regulator [Agromyces sp.]|nr:DeoR/GlpR family DNA-binding transcription regulator [Agromyces sp.]